MKEPGSRGAAPAKARAQTEKTSSSERALSELRRQILENELPPGSRLTEQDIANRLNVSRTPAREALLKLEAEGLVEIRPGRGMRVAVLSVDDVREMYELIAALESHAAMLAALRRPPPPELEEMTRCVEAMDEAATRGAFDEWIVHEETFVQQLARASHNSRLVNSLRYYYEHVRRLRTLTNPIRTRRTFRTDDLRSAVQAILAGEEGQAADAQRRHRTRDAILTVWLLSTHGFFRTSEE